MPLTYEKFPPTADDVRLSRDFISALGGDSDDDMVVFTIGQEDAHKFATDIERNGNGNINLNEVRRGLANAAEALTDDTTKSVYVRGVESFIERQLASR